MTQDANSLRPTELELLRQVLQTGDEQIASTLHMILGQVVEKAETQAEMVSMDELGRRLEPGTLATVRIGFEGDIRGQFLFLQGQRHFTVLKKLLSKSLGGPAHTVNDATDYLVSDWIIQEKTVSDDKLVDALGELGNVLFGGYLMGIYSRCHLATFQDLPEAKLADVQRAMLNQAIDTWSRAAERAFLVDVDCAIGGESFRFQLLMLGEPEGFRAMLENLK